jgi:hypothetical protein
MALPAVLDFRELTVLRGRTSSTAIGKDAQRIWRFLFVEPVPDYEDLDLIENHANLPAVEAVYKTGDPRRLRKKSVVTADNSAREFLVYGDYETRAFEYTLSPLTRKDETSGDFTTESRPYMSDTDDELSLNAAGDLLDQTPTRLAGVFRFTVTGNRAYGQDLSAYAAYFYPFCTFNHQAITIRGRAFGAKKLLMLGASYSEQVENGFPFERWTWQMAVNPLGWEIERIPNRGYNQLVDGVRRKIVTGNPAEPVSQPYPLNANGTRKASPFDVPSDIERKPYLPEDFSFFNWTAGA